MNPARVRAWTVVLQPGDAVDYLAADWADTLLVVGSGELELECRSGQRACFAAGAVLTIATLPVRRLRNPRREPLVLHALTRGESRRPATDN